MRVAPLSSVLLLAAAVQLRDRETIVFYGDSITQQNLYAAYLETFLLSRFPEKDLTVFNYVHLRFRLEGVTQAQANDLIERRDRAYVALSRLRRDVET